MKKILLSQIDGSQKSIEEIRLFILRNIKKNEIFSKNKYTLCFYALACFNFRSKTAKIKDREIIENDCLRILIKSGIYNSDKKPHPAYELGQPDPTLHFIQEVLGFQTTPYEAKEVIISHVIKDLTKIQNLVDWYETLPTIKKYLERKERITSHEERTKVDFYNRCLEERSEITRYLTSGINDRAIIKSQYQDLGTNHFTKNEFFERPYLSAFKYSEEYFDYRNINASRHKIDGEVSVGEYHSLQVLYTSNKSLFYKRLKSLFSVEQVFESIKSYYLLNLPGIATRKPVFDQIERLHRQRQWIALASLSITQVEGLFADMMKAMRKKPSGALPDKVDEVSPFYDGSGSHFDYFKYTLPIIRNRFTHYGQLPNENYKLLALDLIYDVNHLLKVFERLENPLISLYIKFSKRTTDYIEGLHSFNSLFAQCEMVRKNLKADPSALKEFDDKWSLYEKDTLATCGELEAYAFLTSESIDEDIDKFIFKIKENSRNYAQIEIDLYALSSAEVDRRKEELAKQLNLFYFTIYDQLSQLLQLRSFLKVYKLKLPNCPEFAVNIFKKINEKYEGFLNRIYIINEEIKKTT